jgi:hypothetical protein
MPREARRKSKSKIYHIMIRGINQQNIWIFLLLTVKRLNMTYMPIV